jgi:uncharacterized protein DUF262
MPYQSDAVSTIIGKLNTQYYLPAIQREFVWQPEQIIQLFDSLLRGYPIIRNVARCLAYTVGFSPFPVACAGTSSAASTDRDLVSPSDRLSVLSHKYSSSTYESRADESRHHPDQPAKSGGCIECRPIRSRH